MHVLPWTLNGRGNNFQLEMGLSFFKRSCALTLPMPRGGLSQPPHVFLE